MEVQKRNHLLEAVLFFHRQIDDMEFQQIMNQDIDNDKRQEIIERNKKINNHFNNLEDKLFKQETLSKEEIVFFNELVDLFIEDIAQEKMLEIKKKINNIKYQQIMNQEIDNDKRQEIIERNKKINNHFNNLEDKLFKQETLSKEEIVFFNELVDLFIEDLAQVKMVEIKKRNIEKMKI